MPMKDRQFVVHRFLNCTRLCYSN